MNRRGFYIRGCSDASGIYPEGIYPPGFYTEPDGGTRITEETDVPHEDTTYHAHWSANEYRIMFHTKNAHCDIDGKVVTYDKPIGILPVP